MKIKLKTFRGAEKKKKTLHGFKIKLRNLSFLSKMELIMSRIYCINSKMCNFSHSDKPNGFQINLTDTDERYLKRKNN